MTGIDQDLLSLRFEIDECTIFKVHDAQDVELVYRDTIIFSAWASLNGGKEFSLNPNKKSRLKVVSRMPELDASSTYVIWRRLDVGWGEVRTDFPILPQKLAPRWAYKERLGVGHPHLSALCYQGRELDLRGDHLSLYEDVVIVHRAKVTQKLFGLLDLPEA